MTKTVTETHAQAIERAISGGYLALADNGDVIWAETKFSRYGGVSAADLAMAAQVPGFGGLCRMTLAEALYFARQDIHQRLDEAEGARDRLYAIVKWLCPVPFQPRAGVTQDLLDAIEAECDAAVDAYNAVEAEAKALCQAAAERFEAAIGKRAMAELQESWVIS